MFPLPYALVGLSQPPNFGSDHSQTCLPSEYAARTAHQRRDNFHRVEINLREVGQRFNPMDHWPFYQALDMLSKSGMLEKIWPASLGGFQGVPSCPAEFKV